MIVNEADIKKLVGKITDPNELPELLYSFRETKERISDNEYVFEVETMLSFLKHVFNFAYRQGYDDALSGKRFERRRE